MASTDPRLCQESPRLCAQGRRENIGISALEFVPMPPPSDSEELLVAPNPGDGWAINFGEGEGVVEGQREALCTVGNGRWATRGALPECNADDTHYPGTYVAGLYNRLPSQVSDRITEDESLVNVPNWLPFTLAAQDSPWLGDPRLRCSRTDTNWTCVRGSLFVTSG